MDTDRTETTPPQPTNVGQKILRSNLDESKAASLKLDLILVLLCLFVIGWLIWKS